MATKTNETAASQLGKDHLTVMGGLDALEAVRTSFFLPFICFVVIAIFGFRTFKIHHSLADDKLV